MKKTILVLSVMSLLGIGQARAQWSVTPEAGMSAVMSPSAMQGNSWIPSWRIGAGVDYQFPRSRWAVSSGIFFTERAKQDRLFGGYISEEDGSYVMLDYPMAEYKDVVTSFYVPFMAKYVIPVADEVNFSLATGFYIGHCFSRKERNYRNYEPKEWGETHSFLPTYFDWGVIFRPELEVKKWVISAGYEASLGKERPFNYRNVFHTVTLSVGYKFRLGK